MQRPRINHDSANAASRLGRPVTTPTIPLLLERPGIDPAIATGPFIPGNNGLPGTLIFFRLATHFYLS